MEKCYQLSPFYKLSSKSTSETLLHHILDEETYRINDAIHTFLSFFAKKPITFLKGVALFAIKYETTEAEVLPTVNKFFGDMFHQSILIKAEEYQYLQDFPIQKEAQEKEVLKNFNIQKTLSQEYYLSIYLVKNIKNQAMSVLKILHLNAFYSVENRKVFRNAFVQEVEILEKVKKHYGIVQILQYTDNEKVMTLELEKINGISLRQFIDENPNMDIENRKKLFQNIIDAYAHLHSLDVLHGDIHASNILVQDDFPIKLIDFDMSYHNTVKKGEIINTGGVQPYISPEKISKNAFKVSSKRADFRSEVYQIGILGFVIFMEKLPFEADSWKLLAAKIKEGNFVFDEKKLPKEVISFLQKAMCKKPAERFLSAIEMKESWSFLSC